MHTTLGMVAIVEDDAAMRRSLERLLRASGYDTTAFASAEDFLESAIVDRAMGLVLDIHLGGMSGIELRRRLAAVNSPLPVVFITGYDDEATRRERRPPPAASITCENRSTRIGVTRIQCRPCLRPFAADS